jgi:hypothetical protein
MKRRLFIPILISIILIGWATWFRFFDTKKSNTNLIYVANDQNNSSNKTSINSLPQSDNPSNSNASFPTDIDTISKKLFSDYLSLSINGSDTPENIQSLSDKYAEGIATIDKSEKIEISALTAVENTRPNFQNYADQFSALYLKYQVLIGKEYSLHENLDEAGPDLYDFSRNVGSIYKDEAEELKKMKVPKALLNTHLYLVNNYLSSSWALNASSQTETDSASAFAGMVSYKQNVDEEKELLKNIEEILTDNGI